MRSGAGPGGFEAAYVAWACLSWNRRIVSQPLVQAWVCDTKRASKPLGVMSKRPTPGQT